MLKISFSCADITYCAEKSYGGFLISDCEVVEPLEARLLLLEEEGDKYLWINIDACSLRTPFNMALTTAVSKGVGISEDKIFISCIHTHSGHDYVTMDVLKYTGKIVEAYQNLEKILIEVHSIDERVGHLKDGEIINRRVEITKELGDLCIMFNDRCLIDPIKNEIDVTQIVQDELERNYQPVTEDVHQIDGEVDDRIHQWVFKNKNDEAIYNVVRINCHPVSVSQSRVGKFVSSDFVGPLLKKIESSSDAPAMILNGAFGNVRPFQREYSFEAREMIADNYYKALMKGEIKHYNDISICLSEGDILLPLRTDLENNQQICRKLAKELNKDNFDFPKQYDDKKFALQSFGEKLPPVASGFLNEEEVEKLQMKNKFQLWKIGPMRLFCIPGEPLVELAAEIEGKYKFLAIGLSNGYRSYLPHPKHMDRGGYEVNCCIFSEVGLQSLIELPSKI